jgi:hypothetical protein
MAKVRTRRFQERLDRVRGVKSTPPIPVKEGGKCRYKNRSIYYHPHEWEIVKKALGYRAHATQAKALMLQWAHEHTKE